MEAISRDRGGVVFSHFYGLNNELGLVVFRHDNLSSS